MPFITVKLIEGRTLDQKRQIVNGITKVVAEACNITEDRVYLFIEDLGRDEYGRGGLLLCDKDACVSTDKDAGADEVCASADKDAGVDKKQELS